MVFSTAIRAAARDAWGALSDDDVDRSKGSWSQLVGTIREGTGETVDDVETPRRDCTAAKRGAQSRSRPRRLRSLAHSTVESRALR
jgi:uncharacterized protein YjbJ (UPF0337 family)